MEPADATTSDTANRDEVFGARIKRIEDPALLRGRGRFVDDIRLPGMLHAAFVRSDHAHAVIREVSTAAALTIEGVRGAWVMDDLAPHLTRDTLPAELPSAALRQSLDPPVLARDEVRYVGEAIAVVVADDPYIAEDAAGAVRVDYEPLPVAEDCVEGLVPGAATPPRPRPRRGFPGRQPQLVPNPRSNSPPISRRRWSMR